MNPDPQEMSEGPLPGPSLLMRWLQFDLIDKAALGIILLSVILVLGSPYLATNRRQLALLIGTAICLGVGGYVVFDRLYLELNLRLTNARQIREECAKLLQQDPRQRMGNLVCPAVYAPAVRFPYPIETHLVSRLLRVPHPRRMNTGASQRSDDGAGDGTIPASPVNRASLGG